MNEQPAFLGISLKMYFDPARTLQWSAQVAEIARAHPAIINGHARLVVFPSFLMLGPVREIFAGTTVAVGAQDLFQEDRGAYTGAVSGDDLRQLGCRYVEVGHDERRRLFNDDERIVALKLRAAWRNGLTPVLCVGEDAPGPAQDAARRCLNQLDSAVHDLDSIERPRPIVVAYEPSWTIGSEHPADPSHITVVARALAQRLADHPTLAQTNVIYGGSAGIGLLATLGSAVDGLFLGRSVHDAMALKAVLDEIILER